MFSCKADQNIAFKCDNHILPEFDMLVGYYKDEHGKDAQVNLSKYKRFSNLIKPCEVIRYDYQFNFKKSCNNEALLGYIEVFAPGKRSKFDSLQQNEIIYKHYIAEEQKKFIKKCGGNDFDKIAWPLYEITGYIENESKYWLHPFRVNQFFYLEVAPFPMVEFPLKKGMTWSENLSIGAGWARLSNQSVYSYYTVSDSSIMITIDNEPYSCWLINAEAKSNIGISKAGFYFNEQLGFLKMEFNNDLGHNIIFTRKLKMTK